MTKIDIPDPNEPKVEKPLAPYGYAREFAPVHWACCTLLSFGLTYKLESMFWVVCWTVIFMIPICGIFDTIRKWEIERQRYRFYSGISKPSTFIRRNTESS